jgi:hypothetical protein
LDKKQPVYFLRHVIGIFALLAFSTPAWGQSYGASGRLHPLAIPDSLHQGRFWLAIGGGTAIYSGASVILWESWYKGYELGGFRTFNDWGGWENHDKWGHVFTAYNEARWAYGGARWTGMKDRSAMWTGVGVSVLLQTTVEIMDGFSTNWGFSWYDVGANMIGSGLFLGQELLWEEQRIVVKVSSTTPRYPDLALLPTNGVDASSSLDARSRQLFGDTYVQRFLKDYNAQTIWLSANPTAFLPQERSYWWPRWLNVAVGYGAQNMLGAHVNSWSEGEANYSLDPDQFPRYRQYYLSLDVDLTRIPTRSRVLKTVFGVLNFVKIPAPVLEYNSLGQWKGHLIYW